MDNQKNRISWSLEERVIEVNQRTVKKRGDITPKVEEDQHRRRDIEESVSQSVRV